MKGIALALVLFLWPSQTQVMATLIPPSVPTQVDITTVTEADVAVNDSLPRVIMRLDSGEYNRLDQFLRARGREASDNKRIYGFVDEFGNRHTVVGIYKPETGPRKDARLMEIKIFVNEQHGVYGQDRYNYFLAERGTVEYECFCPRSTPESVKAEHMAQIPAGVKFLLAESRHEETLLAKTLK